MYKAKAYSVTSETSPFASTTIDRRDPTEHDVQIEILFCGICHSDLHSVRNEWSEFMPITTSTPIYICSRCTALSPLWRTSEAPQRVRLRPYRGPESLWF